MVPGYFIFKFHDTRLIFSRLLNRADCERKIDKKKLAEISVLLIVGKYGILL